MNRQKPSVWLLVLLLLGAVGCSSVTSEKRIRVPIHVNYTVTDPEFGRTISDLLGPRLVGGNTITQLVNGDQIFPSMLEAIRGAKKTICLENFIWASGIVSTQFVAALSERARAGVKVHVVVDAIGSVKLSNSDVSRMTEAGVQFAAYNAPFPFRLARVNHRLHRKILVVDGKIGFIGGVCISDDWLGNATPPNWRDTHFRVEGPVVGQIQSVFADNWIQTRSEVLHGSNYFPELKPAGTVAAQCFRSGPRDGAENAELTYLLSIAAARQSIRLAHAYFVPDHLLLEALLEARRRGVKVEVIVPSKTDRLLVQKASRSSWGKLLDAGIELYEYQPTLFHCKIMIVDDVWVTAGSVNFDERSFRMNDEANINVLNRDLAAQLIQSFEADKKLSDRVKPKHFKKRNWFSRLFENFVGLFQSEL